MSIGPVPSPGTDSGTQSADPNVRPQRTQPALATEHAQEQPDSGTAQKQEVQHAQSVVAENERSPDVVQVQRDSQLANQIIIKYMDQTTGQMILQVPSTQVLGVARGIAQDFQQEATRNAAAAQAKPAEVNGEGEGNGH
jgi:uncharacterized FlaG/YvyC family protein